MGALEGLIQFTVLISVNAQRAVHVRTFVRGDG